MVPETRFAVPIPTLIVKADSEACPGLTKYHGSYQRIAELLKQLQLPQQDLDRFFA